MSWTPCYDAFQCARFTVRSLISSTFWGLSRLKHSQVPLQYSNASAGESQIALIMSPSNFSAGDQSYLGSILFNPGMHGASSFSYSTTDMRTGGPGGSGVQYILEMDPYFRAIIGPQYDLVGFDPRGTPPMNWSPPLPRD